MVNSGFLTTNSSNSPNAISNLLIPPAGAVQLRDGKTYFVQLPTFLEAETTINRTYAGGATYYFAIALPKNMGEPLQNLEIFQTEGFDTVDFILNDTVAYLQTPSGDRVAVNSKTELVPNQDRGKLTVTFDPPIPANNELNSKLIVGLRPVRNPRYDGVYLFGVAASPQGDRPNSQFLGYGRLHFYNPRH
ncbi:MAG: hypothetical protein DCF19_12600 [Pseudanabaena frigida]|uniref:DUF2808 domain-containing protein n=1 Tax=Pseudanabaena frigida TaxID=945775 RepID=A0A2W4W6R2_9CYAN|nr:MAG: hypothetical protein DCF19_12600 [Pseudanabaena frigida]